MPQAASATPFSVLSFLSVVLLQFSVNHIAEMTKNNFSTTRMHSERSRRYFKNRLAYGVLPDTAIVSAQNN